MKGCGSRRRLLDDDAVVVGRRDTCCRLGSNGIVEVAAAGGSL